MQVFIGQLVGLGLLIGIAIVVFAVVKDTGEAAFKKGAWAAGVALAIGGVLVWALSNFLDAPEVVERTRQEISRQSDVLRDSNLRPGQ